MVDMMERFAEYVRPLVASFEPLSHGPREKVRLQ